MARRIDGDALRRIVSGPADDRGVQERAAVGAELRDEHVAREGVDVGALHRAEDPRRGGEVVRVRVGDTRHVRVSGRIHRDRLSDRGVGQPAAEDGRVGDVAGRVELRDEDARLKVLQVA